MRASNFSALPLQGAFICAIGALPYHGQPVCFAGALRPAPSQEFP
ncbi:hypothetical protein PRJ_2190 [Pseudomonas sp. XWY-1]|nr:hypothetical protein PRJ_2190 [Pseudomonas sp. XWY-1]